MTGSWAGALGQTQFMPSSFLKHAVDMDGDGRRDIWRSVPDVLGSIATYLDHYDWKTKQRWGYDGAAAGGLRLHRDHAPRGPATGGLGEARPDAGRRPGAAGRRQGLAAAAGRRPRPGLPDPGELPGRSRATTSPTATPCRSDCWPTASAAAGRSPAPGRRTTRRRRASSSRRCSAGWWRSAFPSTPSTARSGLDAGGGARLAGLGRPHRRRLCHIGAAAAHGRGAVRRPGRMAAHRRRRAIAAPRSS